MGSRNIMKGQLYVVLFLIWIPVSHASSACTQAGLYAAPSTGVCLPCPAGYYCPKGFNTSFPCPPGQYQSLQQQILCLDCPQNRICPGNATVEPQSCPAGRVTNSVGSTACGDCDYDNYYLSSDGTTCVKKTVLSCNLATHYEVSTPFNRTQEIQCMPLTQCRTDVRLSNVSPIEGLSLDWTVDPLLEYVAVQSTRYSDRSCWAWKACGEKEYVAQLPVDDGTGFLVQPLICKTLSEKKSNSQYRLVDGSATRDRDNVWVDCTKCYDKGMWQVSIFS